jgi:hypothetical protein
VLGTIEVTQRPAAILCLMPKVMPWISQPQQEEVMWQILDGPRRTPQALAAKPLKGVDIWSSGFRM